MRLWGTPITGPLLSRLTISDPEQRRKQVMPFLVAHPETVPLEFIELDIGAEALRYAGRNAYRLLRAIGTFRGLRRDLRLDEAMAQIAVPTLFAWGASDGFAAPSVGRTIAATMPDARVEVLPDTGHLPHVEQPDTTAAIISRFLAHPATT